MTFVESQRGELPPPQQKIGKLSDTDLGGLLAAIGNHEAKALLLLAMRPVLTYDGRRLQTLMNDLQGYNPPWKMHLEVPYSYCLESFAPIGLVATEVLDRQLNTFGFIKTPYGQSTGNSFAGLMLDFSLHHPYTSLYELFGATKSPSKRSVLEGTEQAVGAHDKHRAPLRRLRIYEELLTSDLPMIDTDFYKQQPDSPRPLLEKHLQQMSRFGLVQRAAIPMKHQHLLDLTDDQRTLLTSLVSLVDTFRQQPDILEQGHQLATQIMGDRQARRALMAQARTHSPEANKKPRQETDELVLSALQRHPETTATELQEILADDYEIDLSTASISQILNGLKKAKCVNWVKVSTLGQGRSFTDHLRWKVTNTKYIDNEVAPHFA